MLKQKEILNEKYGLNHPGATIFTLFKNVVTGDFGNSFQYHNQPVWDLIKPRLLPSFEMGLTAMFIGVILGLILGVAAATKQNSWVDYTTTVIFSYCCICTIFSGCLDFSTICICS